MVRTTIRNAAVPIRNREEFDAGNLRGEYAPFYRPYTGLLPADEVVKFQAAHLRYGQDLYIVWSYRTPIAWVGTRKGARKGRKGYVPDVRYSITTSRHQKEARHGLV